MGDKSKFPAPYSFRIDAPELSDMKEALDKYLASRKNKSQGLLDIVRDGLKLNGLYGEIEIDNTEAESAINIEDMRNDLRYELENSLKGFVMDLLKDSGRMAKMNRVSESIANGEEIGDDVLENILDGLD